MEACSHLTSQSLAGRFNAEACSRTEAIAFITNGVPHTQSTERQGHRTLHEELTTAEQQGDSDQNFQKC